MIKKVNTQNNFWIEIETHLGRPLNEIERHHLRLSRKFYSFDFPDDIVSMCADLWSEIEEEDFLNWQKLINSIS